MSDYRKPTYVSDADYTTNAPSYYEELARKQGLIKELAERIWGYEETLNLSLAEIAQRFIAWDAKIAGFDGDVNELLQEWIADGTFDHIINDTIFTWKANQSDLDATNQQLTYKANITYVDTKVAAVVSGSPKGVYATLATLQTAFPTGNTNTYVVSADGKWYYWNSSAWVAGGTYQASVLNQDDVYNLLRIPNLEPVISVTNLLSVIGDFEVDTNTDGLANGWTATGLSGHILHSDKKVGNTAQQLSNSSDTYARIMSTVGMSATVGDVFYAGSWFKAVNVGTSDNRGISLFDSRDVVSFGTNSFNIKNTDGYVYKSVVGAAPTSLSKVHVSLYNTFDVRVNPNTTLVDGTMLINLTVIFGKGKEPTKTQMDVILSNAYPTNYYLSATANVPYVGLNNNKVLGSLNSVIGMYTPEEIDPSIVPIYRPVKVESKTIPHAGGNLYSAFSAGVEYKGKEIYAVRNASQHVSTTSKTTWGNITMYKRKRNAFETKILPLETDYDWRDPNLSVDVSGNNLILTCVGFNGTNYVCYLWLLDEDLNIKQPRQLVLANSSRFFFGNVVQRPDGRLLKTAYDPASPTGGSYLYVSESSNVTSLGVWTQIATLFPPDVTNPTESTLGYWKQYLVAVTRKNNGVSSLNYTLDLTGATGWLVVPLDLGIRFDAPCLQCYNPSSQPFVLSGSRISPDWNSRYPAIATINEDWTVTNPINIDVFVGQGGYTTLVKNKYGFGMMYYKEVTGFPNASDLMFVDC